MKVLVVGGGGREHALAWKLAQSPRVREVLVAPGNAGTAREPGLRNVAIAVDDLDGLVALAQREGIGLTVVGPEAPLAAGIVDRFEAAGLRCFGPRSDGARLESSKAFAKEFMLRHKIPTADYGVASSLEEGLALIDRMGLPVVLKADGLAAGKGVIIAHSRQEAQATLSDMLSGQAFGQAGHRVVVEEFLTGEEASFIAVASGRQYLPMASSQDHKRRDADDQGPNTGGMGAISPTPAVDEPIYQAIVQHIIEPTLEGLAADGMAYTGFLYAGVMLTPSGPRVLEFNARFGDPEAQPILFRLRSDLVDILEAALDGELDTMSAEWDERTALAVVMASGGYPDNYEAGKPIQGLDEALPEDVKVFHGGTRLDEQGQVVTSGGRVLALCALADTPEAAQVRAYAALTGIHFEGGFHRPDIGLHAVARRRREASASHD